MAITGTLIPTILSRAAHLSVPMLLWLSPVLAQATELDCSAPPVKLNGPMSQVASDPLESFQFSADGVFAFYRADDDGGRIDLFRAPVDGSSAAVNLTGDLGDVELDYVTTQDGGTAVFRAPDGSGNNALWAAGWTGRVNTQRLSQGTVEVSGNPVLTPDESTVLFRQGGALLQVPIDGSGPPQPVSDPAITASTVIGFSGDASRIVYLGVGVAPGLFTSQLSQTNVSTNLIPAMVPGDVFYAGITIVENGTKVLFRAKVGGSSQTTLYIAPLDGSQPASLFLGPLPQNRTVTDFRVSADQSLVVYRSDQITNNVYELQSVPVDQSAAPIRISDTLAQGGHVFDFEIAPDGLHCVYTATMESFSVRGLFSASTGVTGPSTKLNGRMAGNVFIDRFLISSDSTRVLYLADQNMDGQSNLHSVPIDASTPPVRLNTQAFGDTEDVNGNFEISNATGHALFSVSDKITKLFTVPLDASASPTELQGPLAASGGGGWLYVLSPDQETVLFSAYELIPGLRELFHASADGSGPSVKVNGPLKVSVVGDVTAYEVNETNTWAVYIADQDVGNDYEIYSVPVAGGSAPVRLNEQFFSSVDVISFEIVAGGQQVVFLVQFGANSNAELFIAPIDGSQPAVELANLPTSGSISEYRVAGSRVVYRASMAPPWNDRLYSVPLDLSSGPVQLHTLDPTNGDVTGFVVDSSLSTVFYLADHVVDDRMDLWAVPINGGQPQQLNPPFMTDGDVEDFEVSGDGATILYRADQDVDGVVELYAVSASGGPSTKLNPRLVSGGDVQVARFAPDGRIVYLADQEVDGMDELYSVSADGLQSAKLNGTLPPSAGVEDFRFGANGLVVYEADELALNVQELFSVPVDGSTSSVRLNQPFPGNLHDVFEWQLDDTGMHVAYLADFPTNHVRRAYGVSVDGSAAPVQLSGALPPNVSVAPGLDLGPGGLVLYRANGGLGTGELFLVPITGGFSQLVSGPLVPGGSVQSGRFAGGHVLYLADQDQDTVNELYSKVICPFTAEKAPAHKKGSF